MSVHNLWYLHCDGCAEAYEYNPGKNAKLTRQDARKLDGWEQLGRKDYCRQCADKYKEESLSQQFGTATCWVCGQDKPISEYLVFRGYLRHRCLSCRRVKDTTDRARNLEKNQERSRQRARLKKGKGGHRIKEHDRARRALHTAVYSGVLVRKPCEVCGDAKSHGHHEDYSKPLDVVWLCSKHHGERHRKYDYEQLLKKEKNT